MSLKVTLYTTTYCPHCRRAKKLLAQKGVPFEEIDVTEDAQKRSELEAKTGWQTVPIIFIGHKFIGGADRLFELEAKGELDSLIK